MRVSDKKYKFTESMVARKEELSQRALDIIDDLRLLDQLQEDKQSLLKELIKLMGGKSTFDLGDGKGPWTILAPKGRALFWREKVREHTKTE